MNDIEEATAFRALSARLGQDPLQVQGAGGNTSIKAGDAMWIKASGTELADAEARNIFVAVNLQRARAEAHGEGDGTCRAALMDINQDLRPSIETTFHAMLDFPVVAHTHSVATLSHAICAEGPDALRAKLEGLPFVIVPYAKPGLPLTKRIMEAARSETKVIILENHGLICAGESVDETSELIANVERRLHLTARDVEAVTPSDAPPEGYDWATEGWIAHDDHAKQIALNGSYYPDHVVFLGPALPQQPGHFPAYLVHDQGIAIKTDATPSQRAMLRCLSDILRRLPPDWTPRAIGSDAEATLLNWDAEKYRQALADRS